MIFAQPRFNQFCLGVSLAVWVFGGMSDAVCAHEYEDGFVERSLTITIRDGVGYGEYQIGLNAKTAAQVLELAQQMKQRAVLENTPKKHRSGDVETSPLAKAQSDLSVKQEPLMKKSAAPPKTKMLPKKVPSKEGMVTQQLPLKVPPKQNAAGVGQHLTDLETIKRFGELQKHWFGGRLKLTRDGQPVALSKVSVEPAARHPFSVVVKFKFSVEPKKATEERDKAVVEKPAVAESKPDLPENRVVDFRIADGLFDGYHGATRYALRTRGSTMLLQSNVAPALVRAERVEVDRAAAESNKGKRSAAIQTKLLVGGR